VNSLAEFIDRSERLVALTGAGCSTESGIPDYRSPGGAWTQHKPVYYQDFIRSEDVRRSYWARSYQAWPRFAAARPNAAHHAFAELERSGRLDFLITQNVDALHRQAGNTRVLELHGCNQTVVCLQCRTAFARADIQRRGEEIPACEGCGGVLKPNVVFFGENVPREKVSLAMEHLDAADALLVAGSSLIAWSGFRFVKRAAERNIPIAIVNIGPTRADALAAFKIEKKCSEALLEAIADGRWSAHTAASASQIFP